MSKSKIPANYRVDYFQQAIKNGLNIVFFDAETSHMLFRGWRTGKNWIGHHQVIRPSLVISVQYLFNNEKKARYMQWKKTKEWFSDAEMLEEFNLKVLSKADITVTQNGDKFDYMVLNERLKAQHLSPLTFTPSMDILKLSRSSFNAASHRLDFRSEQQGLGGKIAMSDADWVDVEERGVPATKKMIPYGCKDVEDTAALFWKELPYYKKLPVQIENILRDFVKITCESCAAQRQSRFDIEHITATRIQCNKCGKKWKL